MLDSDTDVALIGAINGSAAFCFPAAGHGACSENEWLRVMNMVIRSREGACRTDGELQLKRFNERK